MLGTTLDDAAGEAFDKGPACSASAIRAGPRSSGSRGRAIPEAFAFPVARVPGLDFSFSGLKTALLYAVRELGPEELEAPRVGYLAASYQRAIVRALAGTGRSGASAGTRGPASPSSAAWPEHRAAGLPARRRGRARCRPAPTMRRWSRWRRGFA